MTPQKKVKEYAQENKGATQLVLLFPPISAESSCSKSHGQCEQNEQVHDPDEE
jgi:hypothetical protein